MRRPRSVAGPRDAPLPRSRRAGRRFVARVTSASNSVHVYQTAGVTKLRAVSPAAPWSAPPTSSTPHCLAPYRVGWSNEKRDEAFHRGVSPPARPCCRSRAGSGTPARLARSGDQPEPHRAGTRTQRPGGILVSDRRGTVVNTQRPHPRPVAGSSRPNSAAVWPRWRRQPGHARGQLRRIRSPPQRFRAASAAGSLAAGVRTGPVPSAPENEPAVFRRTDITSSGDTHARSTVPSDIRRTR